VKILELGELTCRLTGGDDDDGGGDGPLVVLLHGFGAPGDDLVPLEPLVEAPVGTRFLFPEAPLAMPAMFGDSRAWWMLDLEALDRAISSGQPRDLSGEVPEGMAEARELLIGALEAAWSELGAAPERTVLGGFSQGSMLTADVCLRIDAPLAGLVLLSSTLVSRDEWVPRMAARTGLPVFQSHGDSDPLLPFASAETLRELLVDAGLRVDWHPFTGGHEIPPDVLDALSAFIRRTLSRASG
jgi:phospholipase/carboxylesterase